MIFRTPVFRITDMLPNRSSFSALLNNDRSGTDGSTYRSSIELYVKCENMQKSGSFKFRGALNTLTQLPDEQLRKGIVSYSTGIWSPKY